MSIVTNTALRKALDGVADAVEGAIKPLCGRNLLLGTSADWTDWTEPRIWFSLAEAPEEGERVTLSMDIEVGEGRDMLSIYNTSDAVAIKSVTTAMGFVSGHLELTFDWIVNGANNTKLQLFQRPISVSSTTRIRRVKLERGSVATPWSMTDADQVAQVARGRNLLLGTSAAVKESAAFELISFPLAEAPEEGELMTFSMDCPACGSDRTQMKLYNSGGYVELCSGVLPQNGRLTVTFRWTSAHATRPADNSSLKLYQYPNSGTSATSFARVKLERGGIATGWCRADEDYDNALEALKELLAVKSYPSGSPGLLRELSTGKFNQNNNWFEATYVNPETGEESTAQHTLPNATTARAGVMTAAQATKLGNVDLQPVVFFGGVLSGTVAVGTPPSGATFMDAYYSEQKDKMLARYNYYENSQGKWMYSETFPSGADYAMKDTRLYVDTTTGDLYRWTSFGGLMKIGS